LKPLFLRIFINLFLGLFSNIFVELSLQRREHSLTWRRDCELWIERLKSCPPSRMQSCSSKRNGNPWRTKWWYPTPTSKLSKGNSKAHCSLVRFPEPIPTLCWSNYPIFVENRGQRWPCRYYYDFLDRGGLQEMARRKPKPVGWCCNWIRTYPWFWSSIKQSTATSLPFLQGCIANPLTRLLWTLVLINSSSMKSWRKDIIDSK